jgi:hypothetical protein
MSTVAIFTVWADATEHDDGMSVLVPSDSPLELAVENALPRVGQLGLSHVTATSSCARCVALERGSPSVVHKDGLDAVVQQLDYPRYKTYEVRVWDGFTAP